MKTIIYKCDNDECTKQTSSIEQNGWVEIGSESGQLFINNYTLDNKLISMARHDDIHFCSSKCMINRFFKNETNK